MMDTSATASLLSTLPLVLPLVPLLLLLLLLSPESALFTFPSLAQSLLV